MSEGLIALWIIALLAAIYSAVAALTIRTWIRHRRAKRTQDRINRLD